MYNVHHAEGIILSLTDTGEADRIYTIYSNHFGKVSLFAKSVRLEKSKLRGHLNCYSLIRFSFVEGKDTLRLTDAEEMLVPCITADIFYLLGRMSSFILRMVSGQEKDEAIWKLLKSGFQFIYSVDSVPIFFEPLFKTRFLHRLGYVLPPSDSLGDMITKDDWSHLNLLGIDHRNLEKISTQSLTASQL